MKLKEKWAEESNPYDDVHDYEEHGVWPSAWLAGFEFAKRLYGEKLKEWNSVTIECFELLGNEEIES